MSYTTQNGNWILSLYHLRASFKLKSRPHWKKREFVKISYLQELGEQSYVHEKMNSNKISDFSCENSRARSPIAAQYLVYLSPWLE